MPVNPMMHDWLTAGTPPLNTPPAVRQELRGTQPLLQPPFRL
jgi:hypothetical protein